MDFETKIKIMKEGGNILANIFKEIEKEIKPGVSTMFLNNKAEKLFERYKLKSAFKGYQPDFTTKPYPYSICVSLNEIIVHGLPSEKIILKEGDVVKIDMGIIYKNLYLDAAKTFILEPVSEKVKDLIITTYEALLKAIESAKRGKIFGDIGFAIQSTIENKGFKVIKNLCGHDIGEYLHGDLQVLNFVGENAKKKIKPGLIFTIEPMASLGTEYSIQINEFEFKTSDNSPSSHFEVTIAILENDNIVLTDIL